MDFQLCLGVLFTIYYIRLSLLNPYHLLHPWGKYPTLIGPACSKYTCRAYIPITCQKGFKHRCEHERLRLLFIGQKRIAFERNLSRFRDHMSDDVAMNYFFPPFNYVLGMGYYNNRPRSS